MQAVGGVVRAFYKNGAPASVPFTPASLWSGFPCAGEHGDSPSVAYDQAADHWIHLRTTDVAGNSASDAVRIEVVDDTSSGGDPLAELQAQITALEQELGVCVSAGADKDEQIATLSTTNAMLQDEVTRLSVEVTAMRQALDTGIGTVQTDLQTVFANPAFVIPGDTRAAQFQRLMDAIVQLNRGRKEGVYRALQDTP